MENELYHHGIKGMRWGVRRYQNPDGSLTAAGRKRAAKMESRYEALTGKKIKKDQTDKSNNSSTEQREAKSRNEILKEKTNDLAIQKQYLQTQKDVLDLQKQLSDMNPKQVSAGQKFVNGLKGAAVSIAKDKGTKIVGDYIDKQLRNKLGLNSKDAKSASEILREKAQDYENRQKIDKGQKYFKEGKYAESKKTSDSKDSKASKEDPLHGTVEGEGASKKKTSEKKTKSYSYDEPIDVEWREVNEDNINSGRSYVSQFLLEDKKRK